jgi:anaerobic selenocysteine-containing dehydrogenase
MAEEQRTGQGSQRTVLKALGLSGGIYGAVPCAVDVKDGKVIRIRPLHWDSRYDPAQFNPWKIEKDGKTLEPLLKAAPSPWSLAYKKRTYSPNRVKYPLKRVDWDPSGAPDSTGPGGRNPQNRGKSKYVRISWDEATTLIADAIRRIHKQYGPLAIRRTAAPPCCSTRWAASPSRCATPTAGKAGIGAPATSGARAWWA